MRPNIKAITIFLAVLGIFSLACGLLDEDAANIVHTESVTFSVSLDSADICPTDVDCADDEYESPERIELSPFEFPVDIDIVEQTGNTELQDLAGKFREIEIRSIEYKIKDNTLNFDLPETTLYLGPLESENIESTDVFGLATIPVIPAGTVEEGRAATRRGNVSRASELFKTLQFSAIPYAEPVVEEGDPFPPNGKVSIEVTINLRFTANPLDAI